MDPKSGISPGFLGFSIRNCFFFNWRLGESWTRRHLLAKGHTAAEIGQQLLFSNHSVLKIPENLENLWIWGLEGLAVNLNYKF